jgi:hypothetical protein
MGRFSFFPDKEFSELDPVPVLDTFLSLAAKTNIGFDFDCKHFLVLEGALSSIVADLFTLDSNFFIPDPGSRVKKAPDPRNRFATQNLNIFNPNTFY